MNAKRYRMIQILSTLFLSTALLDILWTKFFAWSWQVNEYGTVLYTGSLSVDRLLFEILGYLLFSFILYYFVVQITVSKRNGSSDPYFVFTRGAIIGGGLYLFMQLKMFAMYSVSASVVGIIDVFWGAILGGVVSVVAWKYFRQS